MDDLLPVLLVEDDPDDAELITYAFKKTGILHPLIVVDDGDRAIDYIRGESDFEDRVAYPLPCLVLLDLKLPRRSGFEVLEQIRAFDATRHTPIVVMTSSNQEADVSRAYALGANSYLIKPIGRDKLTGMVTILDAFWLKLNRTAGA